MGFGTPIRARPALLGRDTSRGGRGEGRETALTRSVALLWGPIWRSKR